MINIGDKKVLNIKLGSKNISSVYRGDKQIWPTIQLKTLIYTTTENNQRIKLLNHMEYLDYIEIEDKKIFNVDAQSSYYTFAFSGEHEVKVVFKRGLTSLSNCFSGGCDKLTSIPEDLFKDNPEVTNFESCFRGCEGLTSIPEKLFNNNSKVTSFSGCFQECTGLTSIPEGLFNNNSEVISFRSCFRSCYNLTSIPEGLFKNNTKVTSFTDCFSSDSKLTSNCPIDNDGTPIYNRSSPGKEGYSIVTDPYYCFLNCYQMADYGQIPSSWR